MVAKKAECWNMPAKDGLPALIVAGDAGPHTLTDEEEVRWRQFMADLRKSK